MNTDPKESFVSCTCNTCSGLIEFDENLNPNGTTIQCPHCGIETILFNPESNALADVTATPTDPAEIFFSCPKCKRPMSGDKSLLGEKVNCPDCGEPFILSTKNSVRKSSKQTTIITTTGNEISGRVIESYIGIARGIVVRSPDLEQQLFGGLKRIVGGNIESFAKMCEAARREAFSRMVEHANTMKADAIIGMRYDATEFAPGITEVLAYGTAVALKKPEDEP
jgi:uncharacterized protein YbjQ (UPF0145 family)/DNA-directed RNA polymerase subunit RPC12/RpoP